MTAPITRKSCVTWLFLFWCVVSCTLILPSAVQSQPSSPEDCLVQGNAALGQDDYATAVRWYEAGIEAMGAEGDENEFSLVTAVSLETNLATAYSATGEPNHLEAAMEHYESAIAAYELGNSNTNDVDETEARAIVSQTAFFYGMELQEVNVRRSIEMYGKAVQLDPELWAAWANLGACACVCLMK
jgi:tetratricopeptide (TPR) repeat protein